MNKLKSRKPILILLGMGAACIFCAVQVTNTYGFGTTFARQDPQETKQQPAKKDSSNKNKKGDKGGGSAGTATYTDDPGSGSSATATNADKPGGSAGGGTITAKGKVVIEGGATFFVTDGKKWVIENPEAVKSYEDKYVMVTGRTDSDQNTIQVTNVRTLRSGKAEKASAKKREKKD